MPRCAKIMHKFVWVMPLRCSPSSTIPSLGCLLDRGPPMLLRPDAHSPIISTEHSLLSWLKVEIRLCNSPAIGDSTFDNCIIISYTLVKHITKVTQILEDYDTCSTFCRS